MNQSRVILFIGAKGGSGTTTLCSELARAIPKDGNAVLVDADLTGRRSVALTFESVRILDAARGSSPIARGRINGVTLVELADRYDAAFTLDTAAVHETRRRLPVAPIANRLYRRLAAGRAWNSPACASIFPPRADLAIRDTEDLDVCAMGWSGAKALPGAQNPVGQAGPTG